MLRAIRPADGLRFGLCLLATIVALTAVMTDPADARGRRKRLQAAPAYNPPYAALVVDANSGNVLHDANADALRHPASLTKIMTLYLLFEQIEAGKLRLDSQMEVSEHASQQAPSKLGLRPGQTIAVEDAIRALVTKSANDAAVVVAEAIGGDEETFATHDDAQGARARHEPHASTPTPPACRTTSRSPPRAIRPRSAARSRIASRATTAISRPRASSIAATRCATTTSCSAASRASTASRPATPARRASIS